MSRFEALRTAYATQLAEVEAYKTACYEYARHLVGGYCDYLNLPYDRLVFFTPSKGLHNGAHHGNNIVGGMGLEEDGFFYISFAIWITEPRVDSKGYVSYLFFLKKVGDTFLLKHGRDGALLHIPTRDARTEKKLLRSFYESIFTHTLNLVRNSFQDFIQQQATDEHTWDGGYADTEADSLQP